MCRHVWNDGAKRTATHTEVMRQSTGSRRGRASRSSGKRGYGGGHGPNRSIESNGPNVKLRGTAVQVYDKYLTLARDANTSGDRIAYESYLQHAEHYFRVMNANAVAAAANNQNNQNNQNSSNANAGNAGNSANSGNSGNGDGRRSRRGKDEAPAEASKEAEAEAADAGEATEVKEGDNPNEAKVVKPDVETDAAAN